jgi:hypothetical protein
MKPTLDPGALRKTHVWEYALRFAFGGAVTAATGALAHVWGPELGGLFLAFPAILPASLTLAATHEGRQRAAEEANGAVLGAIALVGFAAVVWQLAPRQSPTVTLAIAAVTWVVTAIGLWALVWGRGAR